MIRYLYKLLYVIDCRNIKLTCRFQVCSEIFISSHNLDSLKWLTQEPRIKNKSSMETMINNTTLLMRFLFTLYILMGEAAQNM